MSIFEASQELATRSIDLARRYAYPETTPSGRRCYVRANMICSVDGATAHEGSSSLLGSAGDTALFSALRGLSDAIVVGSRTVAVEHYQALTANAEFAVWRRRRQQRSAPIVAVVSKSLNLDAAAEVWQSSGAMVFTCRDAPAAKRATLNAAGVKVISCGQDTVDIGLALEFLAGMGLWRVLVEGGPNLLGQLVAEDTLDELCLTISPSVVGGPSPRIVSSPIETTLGMRPVHVLADAENYLYTRWVRRESR